MDPAKIMVIEDDVIVARTIERSLRGDDFSVTVAHSGVEGLKVARRNIPDLVILDIIMPGMDGYTVCKQMREDMLLSEVPILFLTAKIKDNDRIAGFKAGADDYLTKPFNVDELILRVRAILRRTRAKPRVPSDQRADQELSDRVRKILEDADSGTQITQTNHCLVMGEYVLDTRSFQLHTPHHEEEVRLTPVQFDLIYHLMVHSGQVFSPQRLLDEVWDYPTDAGSPDLVRVHIKNLRERIEEDPRNPTFVRTVPGYGYTVSLEE
jgi:DNA-binding response OmpR family regulator